MPRKPSLSVVGPEDGPTVTAPLTVSQAAATGDHRKLLVAMRERIACTVADANCPPRDLASLSRRLQDIAKEIESLDLKAQQEASESGTTPDEAFDASAV